MADPIYPTGSGAGMAPERDRSAADVVKDIVGNAQEIIRSEVRLAKVEVKEEAVKAARAGAFMGAGAATAMFAIGYLLLACRDALSLAIPTWGSSLIVGLVLAGGAAILLGIGRVRIKDIGKPEQTIQTVKENVEWAKNRMR